MPDRRVHRGPHPEDEQLFAPRCWTRLGRAIDDLSWLLSRGYAPDSSLKLVGDRHGLVSRQRVAVQRCSCSDEARIRRASTERSSTSVEGRPLWLDGYNVLTTVEAALAGGVILPARDRCLRDMASMHGSYRRVDETRPALEIIGRVLADLGISDGVWYLDRPVSNSGHLRRVVEEVAAARGWSWRVLLVPDPDKVLSGTDEIVATADSAILDRCRFWFNLAREVVGRSVPAANVLDLQSPDCRQD
ncbi:MAG: DUF434 domain-containing protein [Candidatus Riflebacteria bacterium]|nr:DUF434 domain-containing protein [Candidatus Riflebacteria bacterium]